MNNYIIDFHTHAFPDFLAESVIARLSEHSGDYRPHTNGKVSELLLKMDESNIDKSFIANIATKPEQVAAIIKWSLEIKSNRIKPLASFYPKSNCFNDIDLIIKSGIKGVKLHPLYQDFFIDDAKLFPIYDYLSSNKIFILFHAGYDVAFPNIDKASPKRIKKLLLNFPNLIIIASHMGGWQNWESVYDCLVGENIYFDTSFIHEIEEKLSYNILLSHNSDYFLFGSDSPWLLQQQQIEHIERLKISSNFKDKIFYKNGINFIQTVNYY